MYHCPECTTVLTSAGGYDRSGAEYGGLYLDVTSYHCPGCGKKFLHRVKEYFDREPTDEWYHVVAGNKTLLMHNPPEF